MAENAKINRAVTRIPTKTEPNVTVLPWGTAPATAFSKLAVFLELVCKKKPNKLETSAERNDLYKENINCST